MESQCTGCGACANICKKNAISIEPRDGYFLFPSVDEQKCTNCGKCRKICPCLNKSKKVSENGYPLSFGGFIADPEVRKESTSGGAFSVLADYVLSKGGEVCGAAFVDGHTVKHIIVDNKQDLKRLHGSKYVQSFIGSIYREIKEYLDNKRYVLFTGTPCQVAGLKSFLGKDNELLITVDLFCHGVPPQKLFDDYLDEVTDGNIDSVKNFQFRNKAVNGWKNFYITFEYSKGKYQCPGNDDTYFQGFRDCLTLRKSCTNCKFSKLPRQGDFTIGDFLSLARRELNLTDDKGASTVIVNNPKAKSIFDSIKDQFGLIKEVDVEKIKCKNLLVAHSSTHINAYRFRSALVKNNNEKSVSQLIQEYLHKNDNIAILNFHDSHNNYGSVLTGYALQEKIKQLTGFSPVHIVLAPPNWGYSDISDLIDFCHEYINETAPCINELKLDALNNYVQTFITGPDGVWRNMGFTDDFYVYLLNFAHFSKNIASYAPSFGLNRVVNTKLGDSKEIPPSAADLLERKRLLKRFNHISVRESSGVSICKDYFDVDAEHVLDAVFLLDANDYRKLIDTSRLEIPDDYFCKYIINQSCVEQNVIEYIDSRQDMYSLYNGSDHIGFIKNTDLDNWKYSGPKMVDWLKLMSKCKFVITDSFHGLCFAIIFKKQFVLTSVTFAGNERHKSLLGKLGITSNRFAHSVDEINEILQDEIDYDLVYQHLEVEKKNSIYFLKRILADNTPNKVKEWMESLEIQIKQMKKLSQ